MHPDATVVDNEQRLTLLSTAADGRWSLAHPYGERRVVLIRDHAGTVVRRLNHDADVAFSYFASDGRSVVTATESGTVRAWLWQANDLTERACAAVGRSELTEEEWRDAFGTAPRQATCRAR
jgi:hypothetical protein